MTDGLNQAVEQQAGTRTGAPAVSPRTASRALYASVVIMVGSMIAISLFFGGFGAFWGPVNDVLVVATVLLLLPAMAVVQRLARGSVGAWFTVLTVAAALGAVVLSIGQLALVAGLITLDMSFTSGGLGVLPVIAWLGATALLVLRAHVLGRAVGWWAIGLVAMIGVTIAVVPVAALGMASLTLYLGLPFMVTLLGWMVSLARDLSRAEGR